jgi:threonine/homoserine/homoserine lactone efflux protein
MLLFFKGMMIGFAIAAPVGPIGILCIRRTLSDGRLAGFVSGLGAAAADTMYGFIAALGLTAIGGFLVEHKQLLSIVGGLFLIYLGAAEWSGARKVETAAAPLSPMGLAGHFVSTLLLTLANPMTILSFIGIFVGLDVAGPGGQVGPPEQEYVGLTALVTGVFAGSALWWLTLANGVGFIRHLLGTHTILWLNRLAGALIVGFGVYALTAIFA